MIISVAEAKKYIATALDDSVLEAKLQALELQVRGYTNNNFQKRNFRSRAMVASDMIACDTSLFEVGDTIQISDSMLNAGLYHVTEVLEGALVVKEKLFIEADVLVTKVEYPFDVQLGVINMLNWDLENRNKVGIQSESISRHSVTYFNMDGDNSTMGYPKSILGFLKPYMKARF